MKYQKLFDMTIENGGATWNPKTGEFLRADKPGYIVGEVVGTFKAIVGPEHPLFGEEVFDRCVDALISKYPDAMAGTWVSEGYIHIDPVRRFASKEVAMGYALALKQEAIYEIHTGKVIGIK